MTIYTLGLWGIPACCAAGLPGTVPGAARLKCRQHLLRSGHQRAALVGQVGDWAVCPAQEPTTALLVFPYGCLTGH